MDVFDSNGAVRITGEQLSLQRLSVVEWELPAGEEEVEAGGIVVSSPEKLSGFLRFRHQDGSGHLRRGIPGGGQFHDPREQSGRSAGLAVYNADDKDLTVGVQDGRKSTL